MSPSDPLSPVSPSSFGSGSPTDQKQTWFPSTPVLSPSLHLPRLVPVIDTATNVDFHRRSSSLLSTPSPLRLGDTPINAEESFVWNQFERQIRIELHDLDVMYCEIERAYPQSPSSVDFSTPTLVPEDKMEKLDEVTAESPIQPFQDCSSESHTSTVVAIDTRSSWSDTDTLVSENLANDNENLMASQLRAARIRTKLLSTTSTPVLHIIKPSQFQASLGHLRTRLVPLISIHTGLAHPDFPLSLLQFYLLTHDQLNSLAYWYHQYPDAGRTRWRYPAPIEHGKTWVHGANANEVQREADRQVDLEAKRRRWGRFIGLRGCESPEAVEIEDIAERMEREWRDGLRRREEEHKMREKLGRDRY